MLIRLLERVVVRCTDPSSPNYLKVTDVAAKCILSFHSNVIPRKGEIIELANGTAYDVVSVVYYKSLGKNKDDDIRAVALEVAPHIAKHTYDASGYTFEEDWPIISDDSLL